MVRMRGSANPLLMPPPPKPSQADTTAAVDRWMEALDDARKPIVAALRQAIRSADASIEEGVKWNSPSFRTSEYFATINLRVQAPKGQTKRPVAVILHLGAKRRDAAQPEIADPDGLLQWLDANRAMLSLVTQAEVRRKKSALQAIVRDWIAAVEPS